EQGLAASVFGALLPTEHPFLYTLSATVTDGVALASVESALLEALDTVHRHGITDAELARAKMQLKARLVFETDSVTNIAHQLGYFSTIATVETYTNMPSRIAAVSLDDVGHAARAVLAPSNATIGWFQPQP
ncbi:MAG: insulinase family protein, partial [Acidobacteriota bacterium]